MPFYYQLREKLNIQWETLTYDDLRKPMISGLGASISIMLTKLPIPQTIQTQAEFWKLHYNQNPDQNIDDYTVNSKSYENASSRSGKADIMMSLDSSGSIGSADYAKAKQFVHDMISFTFSADIVRQGFEIFSSNVETIFDLFNGYTLPELQQRILNTNYLAGITNTHLAIVSSINTMNNAGIRNGVPRIFHIFTDGYSSNPNELKNVVGLIEQNGIDVCVTGITNDVNRAELELIAGPPGCVYFLSNFDALAEFAYNLNYRTYTTTQTPEFGTKVQDKLTKSEKRFYEFEMPPQGINLEVTTFEGSTKIYYSHSFDNPTSIIHDEQVSFTKFQIPADLAKAGAKIYIGFEGQEDINTYELNTSEILI